MAKRRDVCEIVDSMADEKRTPSLAQGDKSEIEPDFSAPLKPIAEFAARPDFPECVLGQHVDIGGYIGVVVAIVKHSIRVRSPEGFTRGFNSHTLRRIYGPPPELEPMMPRSELAPIRREETPQAKATPPAAPAPKRDIIEEPNFNLAVVPIQQLVSRPDFPKCALGQHVEIGGYTGVVVEIVNESLKVLSPHGTSRNYNAPILRKIYGPPAAA